MSSIAYYEASIGEFLAEDQLAVLGTLTDRHHFALEHQQKFAWQEQIRILKQCLQPISSGRIYFEFTIPRMGKRVDVLLVIGGVIFVIEFKVGSETFERAGLEQVHDYALDLKNFHHGSHTLPILPILIATKASPVATSLSWAHDDVAYPVCVLPSTLTEVISSTVAARFGPSIDAPVWSCSGYHPTPTIIEAALALYRDHDVKEIARSDAGAHNLGVTTARIASIIEHAKTHKRKVICFVTGVPGAGKTLAGLNIATSRAEGHADEHAVFLSGNGPLVDVLREALARDLSARESVSKKDAHRRVASFVQNIHHFRDEALRDNNPPVERVVIFDEAQRAWNRDQASKFMQQKRGHATFDMSEPAFLISVMDRHLDWCVIVGLVGGGQEINTGEAGLSEWLVVLGSQFPHWDVHISNRLEDSDYIWDSVSSAVLSSDRIIRDDALHLSVSIRSFRAEALSDYVGHVVDNRPTEARAVYATLAHKYPIYLTRDIDEARSWLRGKARGTERYGLVASSGGYRLRPEGIHVKAKIDATVWFLNDRTDVRSSYYLEEVATEFDIQGLELDWTGVCWDADFRYDSGAWRHFSFRGTAWQRANAPERQTYLKNAYRVMLTRARQGMVIFVPHGDSADGTRQEAFYDQTYNYLVSCGLGTADS